MAALDGDAPGAVRLPNSLDAIRACLAAGAAFVEIDVTALADGDYLLVHDSLLERETTGHGPVRACSLAEATELRFAVRGAPTDVPVPRLSQVVALFREYPGSARLQVDYKDVVPFAGDEPLARLAALLQPLGERAIVSSQADWQLRRLRGLAPWLDLGLDPHRHIDYRRPGRDEPAGAQRTNPPYRMGSYGYWDDHPLAQSLAQGSGWSAAEYLADRCAALLTLVPGASTFYLNHHLIMQSLADGFRWADALHSAGVRLDSWTVDAGNADAEAHLPRLLETGVDYFTTNTPRQVAKLIGAG